MNRPKKICPHPGCRTLTEGGRCERHRRRAAQQRREQPRPKTSERGYGSRWQTWSKAFRQQHPLCAECERNGRIAAAECVDHIKPHEGDEALLFDWNNLQSLCWSCHARKTRREAQHG